MMKRFANMRQKLETRQTSITWKLFFVSAAMFLVFISAVFIFQLLFLDRFYYAEKERHSVKGIEEFCIGYAGAGWNRAKLNDKIVAMSGMYDIQLTIIDVYGRNIYGGMEMEVRDKDGRKYMVDLNDISYIGELKADGLQNGGKVRLTGSFNEDGSKLKPYMISVGDSEWSRGDAGEADGPASLSGSVQNPKRDDLVRLEGTVEYLRLLNEDEYENINSPYAALKAALKQWQGENIKIPSDRRIQEYRDMTTGYKYKMFIFPVTAKGGNKEAIFAIVPLQPVDEAVGVIRNYVWYIFSAAIVFVLFLSYPYSRMVAKPLLKINAAASKMSNMDFSVRCEIHSHDELGSLSDSLNTMSSRLNSTITELKEFVSNASHELKTPIAAMGGYVEALRDDIRRDKRERYIERLQYEVDRMNSLVQNMLELSRMESNTQALNKEVFDLNRLAGEVLEEFGGLMEEKRIKPAVRTAQACAEVFADRAKLGQVIRNFTSNALLHTSSGGAVRIEIKKQENGIIFCIENEGIKIPGDKLDRIWDRFFRIEPSRARDNGGTGLGLAISAKILKLHNAQYGARNTERGVLFYFIISSQDSPSMYPARR